MYLSVRMGNMSPTWLCAAYTMPSGYAQSNAA